MSFIAGLNIYINISIELLLALTIHMCCLYPINVDGMLNELVIAWYELDYLCVVSYPDSSEINVHYLREHIGKQHHRSTCSDSHIACLSTVSI